MVKRIIIMLVAMVLISVSAYSFSVDIVNTEPSPVKAGEYADITVRIFNTGDYRDVREDVSVNLVDSDYYWQVSRKSSEIARLYGKEDFTRTLRIYFNEELKEGYINLPFVVNFDDSNSIILEDEIFISEGFEDPDVRIGSISSSPSEIIPDSVDNELVITLLNVGEKEARLIRGKLFSDSNSIVSSASFSFEDMISSIEEGGQADLIFSFDVEEDARDFASMRLELEYVSEKDESGKYDNFTESYNFDLTIEDSPYLVVESVNLLDSFEAGAVENLVEVTIKNIGDEEAKDARVRLKPDISQPFIFEQLTEYVSANIKPGESAKVIFKAEVLSTANPGNYELSVSLESMVYDKRYMQEDEISIQVIEGTQSDYSQVGYIVISAIIIVSVLIGINMIVSKRKSKGRNKKEDNK